MNEELRKMAREARIKSFLEWDSDAELTEDLIALQTLMVKKSPELLHNFILATSHMSSKAIASKDAEARHNRNAVEQAIFLMYDPPESGDKFIVATADVAKALFPEGKCQSYDCKLTKNFFKCFIDNYDKNRSIGRSTWARNMGHIEWFEMVDKNLN